MKIKSLKFVLMVIAVSVSLSVCACGANTSDKSDSASVLISSPITDPDSSDAGSSTADGGDTTDGGDIADTGNTADGGDTADDGNTADDGDTADDENTADAENGDYSEPKYLSDEDVDTEILKIYKALLADIFVNDVTEFEDLHYCYEYLDDDEIPELFVSYEGYHYETVGIYTIRNGKAELVGNFGSYGCASIVPQKSIVTCGYGGQGYWVTYVDRINDDGSIDLLGIYLDDGSGVMAEASLYFIIDDPDELAQMEFKGYKPDRFGDEDIPGRDEMHITNESNFYEKLSNIKGGESIRIDYYYMYAYDPDSDIVK